VTETESSTTCRYETHISNDFGDPVPAISVPVTDPLTEDKLQALYSLR
jgi:hypothetical protein